MSNLERILVAVDQSEGAEIPLRLGLELAEKMGAQLIVFHSIADDEQKDRELLPPPSNYVDVMVEETLTDLSALAAKVGSGVDSPAVRVVARSGEPADEIHKLAAAEACDLIVIGLRRRSKVGQFLLGSNLQDVLMRTDRPVVTVPIPPETSGE